MRIVASVGRAGLAPECGRAAIDTLIAVKITVAADRAIAALAVGVESR